MSKKIVPKIKDLVVGELGVDEKNLFACNRGKKEIAFARHVFIYLLWRFTKLDLKEIGECVNRDRTLVYHSVELINGQCLYYPEVRAKIIDLEGKCEQLQRRRLCV